MHCMTIKIDRILQSLLFLLTEHIFQFQRICREHIRISVTQMYGLDVVAAEIVTQRLDYKCCVTIELNHLNCQHEVEFVRDICASGGGPVRMGRQRDLVAEVGSESEPAIGQVSSEIRNEYYGFGQIQEQAAARRQKPILRYHDCGFPRTNVSEQFKWG